VKLGRRIALGFVMGLVVLLAVLAGGLGLRARTAQHEAERHRSEAESLVGFMLGDFADKLRPLGRLDLLDSVSGKALAYLATAGERDSLTARVQRASSLNMIAEVSHGARPAGQDAKAALEAAHALLAHHAGRHATIADVLDALSRERMRTSASCTSAAGTPDALAERLLQGVPGAG
jgi:hypothetical protein